MKLLAWNTLRALRDLLPFLDRKKILPTLFLVSLISFQDSRTDSARVVSVHANWAAVVEKKWKKSKNKKPLAIVQVRELAGGHATAQQ